MNAVWWYAGLEESVRWVPMAKLLALAWPLVRIILSPSVAVTINPMITFAWCIEMPVWQAFTSALRKKDTVPTSRSRKSLAKRIKSQMKITLNQVRFPPDFILSHVQLSNAVGLAVSSGVLPMGKRCSASPNHQLLPASYRRSELVPTGLEELRETVCPFLHVWYHQRQLCWRQRASCLRDWSPVRSTNYCRHQRAGQVSFISNKN